MCGWISFKEFNNTRLLSFVLKYDTSIIFPAKNSDQFIFSTERFSSLIARFVVSCTLFIP